MADEKSFLDDQGLVHFWNKVKDSTPSSGDGILNKDGEFNVENAVRGIFTKEEYDLLSEEEKGSGTYFIADDGESVEDSGSSGKASIFGVMWDSSNSSTALTRLTTETDPNELVNTDILEEPVIAFKTGEGSSPFDEYMPWRGMEEYNIVDGEVSYKKDQDEQFSRTEYDTVVYIPEFYYRVVNDDLKWYWYVSDKKTEGFEKHPGSGRYIGRYNTGDGVFSKSGIKPMDNISRSRFRSSAEQKGTGWHLYDYASWCAVWLLYLVEFANWNSQAKIGWGIGYVLSGSTRILNNGQTDIMNYHTGNISGTLGDYISGALQYRNIENPWGNVYDWIDGIIFNSYKAYISLSPDDYQEEISSEYSDSGLSVSSASSSFITKLGYSENFPWCFIPTASSGGSTSTYIPDQVNSSNSEGTALYVGGYHGDGAAAGLFYFLSQRIESSPVSGIGARLMYIPKER